MFEAIERLKQEYTDKHVVVIGDRPELARFVGYTGQIKTVNMNGRALVQFDAWSNTGWYDIALDFLRVVPDPESASKSETQEAAAPAVRVSPPAESAAEKPAKAASTSTAEILAADNAHSKSAAARSGGGDIPTVTHESGPEAPDVE
jgi:hypothetical protein